MANPTGTVTFYDNGVSIGTDTLNGAATDTATFTTSTLSTATHPITAAYTSGDTNFNASTVSPSINQVVSKASATTTVASSVNSLLGQRPGRHLHGHSEHRQPGDQCRGQPHRYGHLLRQRGVHRHRHAQRRGHRHGYVHHQHAEHGHPPDHRRLYQWRHELQRQPVSPSINQVVSKASTTTTVASSVYASVSGQGVTFTATVSIVSPGTNAVANPTGTVTFYDNGVSIGTGTLNGAATDTATFTTSTLSTATHPITAAYTSGDTNFNASAVSPSIDQVVSKASTTTTVASPVNPSVSGQGVTFTATVSIVSPGTNAVANPTGTVTFYDNGVSIGTGTLNGGGHATAPFTTSTLSTAVARQHHRLLTSGDTNDQRSTSPSVNQVVNQAARRPPSTSSVRPPRCTARRVTFTATVRIVSPGVGTPTGTVTFKDGATTLGTGTLSGGVATLTVPSTSPVIAALAVGTHSITASYGGDTNDLTSTSSARPDGQPESDHDVRQRLDQYLIDNQAVSLGQPVTLTATVTANEALSCPPARSTSSTARLSSTPSR